MTALDAPTQPRIARSRQLHCPAPPPRRAVAPSRAATIGVEPPRTVARVRPHVVTHTLARPSPVEPEVEPRRSWRWVGVLVAALTAGLVTGVALAVTGVGVLTSAKAGPTSAQALRAVQHLGPQQSAPQAVSTTFVLDQSSFVDLFTRVRYRAVGQAQATVDLGAVTASDVRVRGRRATVRIPAAQLDPPIVDDSQTGPVNARNRNNPDNSGGDSGTADVQSQVQQHLTDTAQTQGVPAVAQQLAIARVRTTLRRLGFATVDVTTAGN